MKTVANVIGVARSNLAERAKHRERKPTGRPPQPDAILVAEIKAVIADLPTYGYRRVHAILRRRALAEGRQPPNHKRVYGAMKRNGLLLRAGVRIPLAPEPDPRTAKASRQEDPGSRDPEGSLGGRSRP